MSEFTTIKIESYKWESIVNHCNLDSSDYEVKLVTVVDELFKEDETYRLLKKASDKAYKQLEEYKFKKRHNII
jgi:hypothetical protein